MEERNMGLSRRRFTREFKLAAIERLELGDSVVAVSSYRYQSRRSDEELRGIFADSKHMDADCGVRPTIHTFICFDYLE
jgi:hypothetical protein